MSKVNLSYVVGKCAFSSNVAKILSDTLGIEHTDQYTSDKIEVIVHGSETPIGFIDRPNADLSVYHIMQFIVPQISKLTNGPGSNNVYPNFIIWVDGIKIAAYSKAISFDDHKHIQKIKHLNSLVGILKCFFGDQTMNLILKYS